MPSVAKKRRKAKAKKPLSGLEETRRQLVKWAEEEVHPGILQLLKDECDGKTPAPAPEPLLNALLKHPSWPELAETIVFLNSMVAASFFEDLSVGDAGVYLENHGSAEDRIEALLAITPIVRRVSDREDAEQEARKQQEASQGT